MGYVQYVPSTLGDNAPSFLEIVSILELQDVSERPRLWKAKATRRQRQVKVQRYVGLHRTKHPRENPMMRKGENAEEILKRFSVLPGLLRY